MNSACGLFAGAQKSGEKSDSDLQLENGFSSDRIGESEIDQLPICQKHWDFVSNSQGLW